MSRSSRDSYLDDLPRERGAAVNIKALLLVLVVLVIVVGATGGDASAAAVGSAIGEAVHLVTVAWDAMVSSGSST